MGRFLYLTAKAASARNIVEFGTSFGISTIYLATAAMETGGHVTGSELEDTKAARAQTSLADAGLSDVVDIRVGDALETLSDLEGPVDLLFLDGWKDLYIPVLDLLEPRLAPGALVLADNIRTFPDDLAAYVEYVNRPGGPYTSVILPFESGLGYSLYRPDAASN
jgi:predicted O-methyltransferase YrrM